VVELIYYDTRLLALIGFLFVTPYIFPIDLVLGYSRLRFNIWRSFCRFDIS